MSTATPKGVALVTGAGQGIGKAIALRLSNDGYDVAINDISSEKLEGAYNEIVTKNPERKCVKVIADVSVEKQVKEMVEEVVKALGGLDVMIANAGIAVWVPFLETTEEMLDRLMDINIKGTFFCYKYAAEQMIKQGRGGRIIGASSEAGKRGSMRMGAYSATKFAIRGLTQSAALDLGRHGITVNAYAPGGIDTQMLKNLSDGYAKTESAQSSDFYKWLADKTPVGYSGTPAEIASLVSYLVSKEAHFITGQSIGVNGGTFFD